MALSDVLRHRVDPLLEAVMRRVSRRDVRGPMRAWLAAHHEQAKTRALERFSPEVARLEAGVLAGDDDAVARYDALVAEALRVMRKARPGARSEALLAAIDARLYRDEPELMDDPSFPEEERKQTLDLLDRFNTNNGLYASVAETLAPLVERAAKRGGRPIVHDVAAGHGGLALFLAERMGGAAAIEASDLRDEYLELGRARAKERGLSVAFSVEDALVLAGPSQRGVDVVTCTQALHHFPPGMIARMIGAASRAARVGICFVDGERSVTTLALVALAGALYGRTYAFFHDSVTSVRRMFYEEELALCAALAPGMPRARVETGMAPPSHCFVRVTREDAAHVKGTP
jgi:2-polyprenyl-3-methyl-5-hydroxy-6-metoxy-1,4-benzoquinol methylase